MTNQIRTSKRHDEAGFTLVELLVVVVILGVLAGIVVFAVGGLTTNSVQAACKSDYKSVEVAVETFKAQEGIYPTAGQNGISGSDAVAGLMLTDTSVTPNVGPWLRDQPTNGQHYRIIAATDGTGKVQVYTSTGGATIPAPPVGSPTATAADCSFTK